MPKTFQTSSQRKNLMFILGVICLFGVLVFAEVLSESHGYTQSWSTGNQSGYPLCVEENINKTSNSGCSHSVSHSTSAFKYF